MTSKPLDNQIWDLEAEVRRLRAALMKYGQHLRGCNDWNDKGFEHIQCDCGWAKSRKASTK